MDKSEVCPDRSRLPVAKKPSLSTGGSKTKRFKPGKVLSLLDSVLEYITEPINIPHSAAVDRCFRLNGELITLPQNDEEEKAMDNVLWDFMLKRVENNMTKLIEDGPSVWTWVAAVTRMVDENSIDVKFEQMGFDVNSKQQTYPPNGELDLVHPYTGGPLKRHRPGFVWPQMMTYYKFPQLCLSCISSMKEGMYLVYHLFACFLKSQHSLFVVFVKML